MPSRLNYHKFYQNGMVKNINLPLVLLMKTARVSRVCA
ncbi:hypothetical protein CAMSH0001_0677 [Campylobacter showae RM3277]|uniref:Uncharacterized protein n=1 Tax=Campylobacter showae RM3277 TaxID=553219 RepID=C6RGM1_9BACT|nr:hypothetical protein CAMSH0001_0677 [Campylobacter showae RM3277]